LCVAKVDTAKQYIDASIYMFYILSACFREDKDIIKVHSAVVIKGII